MTPEPSWVDLGLPSGKLWASANVGANVPESAGLYFSWGNTVGHPAGTSYVFSQEAYDTTPGSSIEGDVPLANDAARVIMGSPWRIPSTAEFNELLSNCSSIWTTLNGIPGRLYTSNINGRTIFFPAVGDYIDDAISNLGIKGFFWGNHSNAYQGQRIAQFMGVSEEWDSHVDYTQRYMGLPIRAIRDA